MLMCCVFLDHYMLYIYILNISVYNALLCLTILCKDESEGSENQPYHMTNLTLQPVFWGVFGCFRSVQKPDISRGILGILCCLGRQGSTYLQARADMERAGRSRVFLAMLLYFQGGV